MSGLAFVRIGDVEVAFDGRVRVALDSDGERAVEVVVGIERAAGRRGWCAYLRDDAPNPLLATWYVDDVQHALRDLSDAEVAHLLDRNGGGLLVEGLVSMHGAAHGADPDLRVIALDPVMFSVPPAATAGTGVIRLEVVWFAARRIGVA